MINMATMEGVLYAKPVLLESSRYGSATEFNLEHSDLSGKEPVVYTWRCRASGNLAVEISEKAVKGQVLVVAGEFVQETVSIDGKDYPVVKIRITQCAYGRVRNGGPI